MRRTAAALAIVASTLVAPASAARAGEPIDTEPLRDAVTVQGIKQHLQKFQDIATEFGNRLSGTPGYDASADYVAKKLEQAGYRVRVQPFDFLAFEEESPAKLARLDAAATTAYDVQTLLYSGSGSVEGLAVGASDLDTAGCTPSAFRPAPTAPAQIALVRQGDCELDLKVDNAVAAGYDAVILIANEGSVPTMMGDGQLTEPASVPVVGVTYAAGADLLAGAAATIRVETDTATELRTTANVIGTSPFGRRSKKLVVGAHLDSVATAGINDNGSGSATILEIAEQVAELEIQTRRKLKFAFWGAEEFGLIGSRYYVNSLTPEQRERIVANLNFDMVGSTNFVRFVYDGDGSGGGPVGPPGSAEIEAIFIDYFASQDLASDPTPFNGRSDYGPFIAVGIPAGGLFTGAEGQKTEEQADVYGGTAGAPYDSCYHQTCDTITNVSNIALDHMSDAAAHTTLVMAHGG